MVPSQKASTSARGMPEVVQASVTASTRRSSGPLSQCSPKGVQPIPTMATRSRIPLLAIRSDLRSDRLGFPEVVVDALGGEQPPERHLHPLADGHGGRVD